jgi:hypothetical protein
VLNYNGVWFSSSLIANYISLMKYYQYSTDLKTWKPCGKVVS